LFDAHDGGIRDAFAGAVVRQVIVNLPGTENDARRVRRAVGSSMISWKLPLVKSPIFETAAGWRSNDFGDITISGFRKSRLI